MFRKCLLIALSLSGLSFGAIDPSAFVMPQVESVVGMPMTPMSYAGVARRTTRRTVAVTAAVANPYW
jgi:hypothetical protein